MKYLEGSMFSRLAVLAYASAALNGATIVSVGGVPSFSGSVGMEQSQTTAFSTSSAYANVTISALISGPATETVDAWLTTSVGPGTTAGDVITSTSLNFPGFPATLTPIFSGLALPAGTYYLTLYNPSNTNGSWSATATPVITAAPGATHVFSGYHIELSPPTAFAPEEIYAALSGQATHLIYDVSTAAIPEPGTFAAGVGALLLAAAVRSRRSRGSTRSKSS
jgi:hypothetical protein